MARGLTTVNAGFALGLDKHDNTTPPKKKINKEYQL